MEFLPEDDVLLRFGKTCGEKNVCPECGQELIELRGVGAGKSWEFSWNICRGFEKRLVSEIIGECWGVVEEGLLQG